MYLNDKAPKVLYKYINPIKHNSLPKLYFKLKYKYPKKILPIYLQLNGGTRLTKGYLEVSQNNESYILRLEFKKPIFKGDRLPSKIYESYASIEPYYRNKVYKIYDIIYSSDLSHKLILKDEIYKLHISYSNLFKNFKTILGVSPNVVKRDRQLLSFKRDLINKDNSIINLFLDSGFQSRSHLYTLFKSTFKMTPKDFQDKFKKY